MATELDIKAEFEVEKVTGNFKRMITVLEEDHKTRMINGVEKVFTTRKMKQVEETFTDGVMIYYPQGHSLFVAADDEAQLIQLGITADPRLVDMNSGEVVPENYNLSNKEIVQRKERNRPRAAHTGGIAAALEG